MLHVTPDTVNAIELVNSLVELQGHTTALDKLVGRLMLTHPQAVIDAACAEQIRLGNEARS